MNNIVEAYEESRKVVVDRSLHILSVGYDMEVGGVVDDRVDPNDTWHIYPCEDDVYVTVHHINGYDDMMDHTIEYTLPKRLYADTCTDQDIKDYWQGIHNTYVADTQLEGLISLILTVYSTPDHVTTILEGMVDGVDYTLYNERMALAKSILESKLCS